MIVKIQQSLHSSQGTKSCLIYDKSRDVYYQTEKPEEVDPLVKLLGDRPKAYFEAEISKKGKIEVGKEVEAQDW